METASLKLKVAPPPPSTVKFSMLGSDYIPEVKENLEITGWSSLQNLSSTSPKSAKENDSPYIHPFQKKSLFSKTSENISLELCTENLGSESGTDISDCSIFSNSYSSLQNEPEKPKQESRNFNKAANSSRSFPPPLTTISGGSNSLRVRRHCDGDRLIIQAVESPFKPTYLQAERSHGRLRLCFFQDSDTNFDPQTTHSEEDEDEDEDEECDSEVEDELIESDERYAIHGEKYENSEIESEQEDDDAECDMRIGQAVDVEMGMEKFQRLSSRCKESGHGDNWKPALWVAIS
ncbi:Protein FANTASTIC FOUR 1 [Abeliophyllum distichum]|uniref:Protein FANTASTIC FOUR 1 n=1 Tax=Abeliophyllum distichum TaxID=126358 RepID=A0ABD1Q180_9LAMI